jgi:hypothetical protein
MRVMLAHDTDWKLALTIALALIHIMRAPTKESRW